MAQQQLSVAIRAKQAGMSRRDYAALMPHAKARTIPYGPNPSYELRSAIETVGGRCRVLWKPWYIGLRGPYPIYDVHQSTNPAEVYGDLTALLRGDA